MVSVIVRTKNEEKHIGYCIQSVTDFIGKPEIIIVDNESTDSTIPIINRFEYFIGNVANKWAIGYPIKKQNTVTKKAISSVLNHKILWILLSSSTWAILPSAA